MGLFRPFPGIEAGQIEIVIFMGNFYMRWVYETTLPLTCGPPFRIEAAQIGMLLF